MSNQDSFQTILSGYSFLICILLIVLIFKFTMPDFNAKKKYGKNEFLFLDKFKFTGGLNLPQNVMCRLICLKSRVIFISSGQEFNLPTEKIIDVSIMTNTEIQKQYVSSIGGAIAGGMLLGPVGAILGGSASQKSIKKNNKYLIFTYKETEESQDLKYIVFEVTKNIAGAKKFEKKFKFLKKKSHVQIDL